MPPLSLSSALPPLAAVALALSACAPLPRQGDSAPPTAACTTDAGAEAQVLKLVNAERAARGLSRVRRSAQLDAAARRSACDQARINRMGHQGSDGSTMRDRILAAGYPLRYANENVGYGFRTPQSAVGWWMNSPGHRDNFLVPRAREIGIGVARGQTSYWTTVMGEPK